MTVSPLPNKTPSADGAATQILGGGRGGMDRRIEVAPWKKYVKPAGAGVAALIVLIVAYAMFATGSGRTVKVESGTVSLAPVARGAFEDFVPIRGRVTPL